MAKGMTLRDWACPSYGTENGRAVSSVGGHSDHAKGVSTQMPSTPKGSAMDVKRSSSADTGRRKMGATDCD